MDEDMSDLKMEFRAQRRLLQAPHDAQQEHTMVLSEQSATHPPRQRYQHSLQPISYDLD